MHRSVKYWLGLQRRYGCSVSSGLLMLAELMILEVKVREQMPLSPELNFIGLASEGLQKKHFYQEMHERLEGTRKVRS